MRVLTFALLLAVGCAQAPTSPTVSSPGAAERHAGDAETAAALDLQSFEVLPRPFVEARALASSAGDWRGGLDLDELQATQRRAHELRAELRGGYERAIQRLRGSFTLPSSWRKPSAEPAAPATQGPAAWVRTPGE